MCGINGIISKAPVENLKGRALKMNRSIMHRGPDAGNVLEIIDSRGILGHRRLSIIDLNERSNQPMDLENGIFAITYNGEIYNYENLKQELSYQFKTASDTEVLLAGLSQQGISFINKCNGMFAFGFWNNIKKELILCRDRLGIKPLYYYCDGEKVIFSSEIKGILSSGLVEAKFNYNAIDDYLGYRYVREPYTFFENIYQVEAGTFCCFNSNLKKSCYRYWDIPDDFNLNEKYDESSIKEQFREQLHKSVKRRMISDVPLGAYLSGGVDSSILSAITAKETKNQIHTYTIGFEKMNEFAYAQMVAEKYDTIHHEILIDEEYYLGKMEEIIGYKDAPLGVPNEIPLAIMSKKLKTKITVVLSGEGADELLGGYGRIFRSPFDYYNHDSKSDFYDFFIQRYEYVPRHIRDKYIDCKYEIRNRFDQKIREKFSGCANEYNVFYFFHKYHVKGLLQRVDTTTMLTGVEARVPFLDHELIEFAYAKIPYEMKLRWKSEECKNLAKKQWASEYSENLDIPKAILREIAYDYLPVEVIERKKVGFPVPLAEWTERLSAIARQELDSACWLKSTCDIEEMLRECILLPQGAQVIWMLINIQLFYKQYFGKKWEY